MPSLIEQLQQDALDKKVPVSDLLRKTKVAAAKLGRQDLSEWVEHELTGYGTGEIPPYRRLRAELKFKGPYHGWQPIIGSGHELQCASAVAELEELLARSQSNDGYLCTPVPQKVSEHYSRKAGFVVDVRAFLSPPALAHVLDAVRTTILDWALKLEQAGVRGDGLSFSKAEAKSAQRVTINIGNVGNAVGLGAFGDNATITATQELSVQDLAARALVLVEQLTAHIAGSSGLPPKVQAAAARSLKEIRAAAEAPNPDRSRIRRGLESLRNAMEGAAGDLIAAGAIALIQTLLTSS